MNKVVIDGISGNMVSLSKYGKYGATNTKYPTTLGYYVAKYV